MKPLAANTLLQNRYLVVHLIGRGGMGEVYLAIDQRLGNPVALKRTAFFEDATLGNAFEREAKILARLRHAVLPKVSDHFVEDGNQYLVMEYIAGDDLAKRLEASEKPFPLEWVTFWADKLLDALDYLHSNEPPIVHRDIKPQNLKLTEDNQIVLLDFGLSKNSVEASRFSTSAAPSVVGYTPQYAPMEQIRGTGTDARSDIFSLSSTLYQLLTGSVPPDALTRADAILSGKSDPLAPVDELNPQIPLAVSAVILKGMEITQDKRFSGAREMQNLLRESCAPEIERRSPLQISAFANRSETTAAGGQQISLKTNVVSTPGFETREQRDGVSINSPKVGGHNLPTEPVESTADFAANSSANNNLQINPFTTSIPRLPQSESPSEMQQFAIKDSVAPEKRSNKKSPLMFVGAAAVFLTIAAIGFGFYNSVGQANEPQVGGADAPVSTQKEAAAKPAEANTNLPDAAVPDNASVEEKQASGAAENPERQKSLQPPAAKQNQKSAQQQNAETKSAKPTVKPTAKTAPTPLPRILP